MQNNPKLAKASLLLITIVFLLCKPTGSEQKKEINIEDYVDPTFTLLGNNDFISSGLSFDTGGDLGDSLGYGYDDIREPDERGWTIFNYCGGFDLKKKILKIYFLRPDKTEYLTIVSKKDDLYYLLNENKTKVLKLKVIKEQSKNEETGESRISYEYRLYKLTGDLNKRPLTTGGISSLYNTYEECIEWNTANYKGGAHSSPDYAPEPNENKTE